MDNAVSGAMKGRTMTAAGEKMGQGPTAPHPFAKADVVEAERAEEQDRAADAPDPKPAGR